METKDGVEAKIREAVADDVAAVRGLYGQLAPDVLNVDRDFPVLLDDPNARCLILERKSKPIGMVICYLRASLSSGKKMVVEDLVIAGRYR